MGIADDLPILESRLKELIICYEQYFLGLEKREPIKLLDEVEKLVRRYATTPINNTMYKHRYTNLVARFNTYRQQWNRIVREIEEGRYSRDRFRAGLRDPAAGTAKRGVDTRPEQQQDDLERVYAELLEARRSCNLPTDGMSRQQLAETLDKQRPVLTQKLGTDAIQFRVVVENGKPKIKARVKQPDTGQ